MPRSPDGAYSLPPGTIVASGDTLLPSQHNPAMQDIAAALGNSLDRNGAGGMRAPLEMGGNAVRNAAPGTQPTDLATIAQLGPVGVPVGSIFDFAGANAPEGYLLCFGQSVSRTTYSDLFSAIGLIFGSGDGLSTFNLPDYRGRAGVGKDDMGGTAAGRLTTQVAPNGSTLGAAGGAETHTLTEAQMPSHRHTVNTAQFSTPGVIPGGSTQYTVQQATSDTSTAGGGAAHNNVQPTIVFNKIIKAVS